MIKDKKTIIIIVLVVILGISLIVIGYLLGTNKIEIKNVNNSNNLSDISNTKVTKNIDEPTISTTTTKKKENLTEKDKIILKEIEEIDKNTDTLLKNNKSEDVKDKAKGIFISLVDFLFYDGKIKDVTFDELSESGKKKILDYSKRIDEKIENKYPNYKDTINTKTKDAYNKASELIKKGSKDLDEFARKKMTEEEYNSIIDAKEDIIKYTKKAGSIIKDYSINIYSKSKDVLSTWYKNFKNKKN